MNFDMSSSISLGTLIVLAGKWYHDHMTIKDIKLNEAKRNKQISHIETENVKIIEALERTYVSKDYIFKYFFSREDIELKMKHLENTLTNELSHVNKALEKLTRVIEKRSN
jgi:hypothetical protein